MKRLFTFLWIFIAFSVAANASHIYGGAISYKNLGNEKYEITLTVYRDCNGTVLGNVPVEARCSIGWASFTLPNTSVKDVTGISLGCTTQSKCSGSYPYGIEEHVFKGVADLSTLSCCEVKLSYDGSGQARISNISTIGTGSIGFYMEAVINKCAGTTLVWNDNLSALLEVGNDQQLNFSATDTVDYDSISYEMVEPLQGVNNPISYSGSFTNLKPLTFLGFPNAGLTTPAGFQFNSTTGNMTFRPTVNGQVTILAVQATEWRNISGVMTKVGRTRKDVAITIVNDPNNKTPYQVSENTFYACAGDTSAAIIDIKDADLSNTFSIQLTHSLKWAQAELVGGPSSRKIRVRYLADAIPATGIGGAFTVQVTDNHCPLPGKSMKTYSIMPGGSEFTDTSAFTKSAACGKVKYKLTKKLAGAGYIYSWVLRGPGTMVFATADSLEATVTTEGWVNAELWVVSKQHCNYFRYTDSVFVDTSYFVEAYAGPGKILCHASSYQLSGQAKNGVPPYTFNWIGNGTSQNITVPLVRGDNTFQLEVIDASNCKARDEVTIYNSDPLVKAQQKGTITCQYSTAAFTVDTPLKPVLITQQLFVDSNYISGTNKFIAYKEKLYVEDYAGCSATDSSLLLVSDIRVELPVRTNYCKDSILTVTPVIHAGNQPIGYVWHTGSRNQVFNEKVTGLPANTVFLVKVTVTDRYGCTDSAVGQAKVLPLPVVTVTKPKDACTAGAVINLTANGQPAGGIWTGTAVTGSLFSPAVAGKGTHALAYQYTDSATGCINGNTTDITVINPPVIDFTADTTKILPGRLVTFTNKTTADKAFNSFWRAGQMTGQNKDAVFLFSTEGEYDITLRINDGVCPPDSIVKKGMIKVGSNYLSVGRAGKELKVYPNPASERLYFNTENITVSNLAITDITGRDITAAFTVTESEIINSSSFNGICLITIITADNIYYHSKVDWR